MNKAIPLTHCDSSDTQRHRPSERRSDRILNTIIMSVLQQEWETRRTSNSKRQAFTSKWLWHILNKRWPRKHSNLPMGKTNYQKRHQWGWEWEEVEVNRTHLAQTSRHHQRKHLNAFKGQEKSGEDKTDLENRRGDWGQHGPSWRKLWNK